jgi:hypothetical protein
MAQSTPELLGSLLTTGVNAIPAVLPTDIVVVVGGGVSAIETAGCVVEVDELLLLPPQAARKEIAPTKIIEVRIRRLAATADLLEKHRQNIVPA